MLRFKCKSCDQWHEGVPALAAAAPLYFYAIPANERDARCVLTTDTCVVDDEFFFVRGCLEIPIHGSDQPFEWGVWVSLSQQNFEKFLDLFEIEHRAQEGPYFGWLSASIAGYPETENLKVKVHLRDNGIRPFIELEPTDHPLSVEQREGISLNRLAEICSPFLH
jgi:hypothetical protein